MKCILKSLLFLFLTIGDNNFSQISNLLTEHYFYQNGKKVYYPLRSNEFYVLVKPINNESNNLAPQASIDQISALLDSLGLFISYKNYNDEALLKYEAESINGQSAFRVCEEITNSF